MADDKVKLIFDMLLGKNEVQKGLKDVETQTKQVEKATTGLSNLYRAMGPIIAGAFSIVTVKKAIDAAIDQEKATKNLNIALARTGEYSKEASDRILDLASSLQQTSVHEDDVILGQIALAKAFGQTNQQAEKTVKAAIDLSAAMGISLETAVQMLSKAYSGQLGQLAKIVPETKKLSKEMLEAGLHVDIVAKSFDGISSKQMNSFSGQLNIINKLWGDLLEEFGNLIIQSPEVVSGLQFVANGLRKLIESVPEAKEKFSSFTGTLKTAIGFWADYANGVFFLDKHLEKQGFTIVEAAKKTDLATKSADNFSKSLEKMSNGVKEVGRAVKEVTVSGVWGNADLRMFDEKNMAAGIATMNKIKKDIEDAATEKKMQMGAMLASSLSQGAAGAGQFISGVASTGANAIIPGSGAIVGPLVQLLGMNSEMMRQTIRSFVDGAAQFILNIVENIPILITELTRGIPRFIDAIIKGLPRVISSLIASVPEVISAAVALMPQVIRVLIDNIPSITQAFINGFIAGIPSIISGFIAEFPRMLPELVKGLGDGIVNAIKDAFKKFNPLSSGGGIFGDVLGGVGDVIGDIGGAFGFSSGGVVPGRGSTDTVPIMATAGERVLTVRQNELLEQMLSQMVRGGSGSGQGPIQITLQIGSRELSKVLLDVSRSNMRAA